MQGRTREISFVSFPCLIYSRFIFQFEGVHNTHHFSSQKMHLRSRVKAELQILGKAEEYIRRLYI